MGGVKSGEGGKRESPRASGGQLEDSRSGSWRKVHDGLGEVSRGRVKCRGLGMSECG